MRRLFLAVLLSISFIVGALGARTALARTTHFPLVTPGVVAIDTPPRIFLAAATLVSANTDAHTLLVDMPDPYGGNQNLRMLIAYDNKTLFRPELSLASFPMSDTLAESFSPGDRLFISIARTDGPLHATAISFPHLRDLLSSNS